MRCSQSQYLLSLDLDGRLASGQRQLLQAHLAGCAACGALHRELGEAHELALSLPDRPVTTGFRDGLWERIRAGEGSPEAVFQEPIPLRTKVTYFATGALAAGVLILVANLARPPAVRHEPPRAGGDGPDAAAAEAPGGRALAAPTTAAVAPASPSDLATLVADGYTDAVRHLRERARAPAASREQWVEQVRQQAERAREFASTLRWFVDRRYMYLPPEAATELATVELLGKQVLAIDDAHAIEQVLQPVTSLQVESFPNYFCNPCVDDEGRFFDDFLQVMRAAPRVRGSMPVQVVPIDGMSAPGGPTVRLRFLIRGGYERQPAGAKSR